jgi:hypothetical protein
MELGFEKNYLGIQVTNFDDLFSFLHYLLTRIFLCFFYNNVTKVKKTKKKKETLTNNQAKHISEVRSSPFCIKHLIKVDK